MLSTYKLIDSKFTGVTYFLNKIPSYITPFLDAASSENIKLYLQIYKIYPSHITDFQITNIVRNFPLDFIKEFFLKFPEKIQCIDEILGIAIDRQDPRVVNFIFSKFPTDKVLKTIVVKDRIDLLKDVISQPFSQDVLDYCLMESSRNGNFEIVKILAKRGADHKIYNYSPFQFAIANQHYSIAKFLYNLDDFKNLGYLKIIFATMINKDNVKAVKIMLSNPLFSATRYVNPGSTEMAKLLCGKLDAEKILFFHSGILNVPLYYKTLYQIDKLQKELQKLEKIVELLENVKVLAVFEIMIGLARNKIYQKNNILKEC